MDITEFASKMGRLEERIEALIDRLDRMDKLEERISSLERWRAFLVGAGTIAGAAGGWIANQILK